MAIIKYVQLSFATSKEFKFGAGKAPGTRRFGWAQFAAANLASDMLPISFRNQILVPNVPNANKLTVYTDAGNTWTGQALKAEAQGYDVVTSAGVINIARAIFTGITNGVTAPASYQNNLQPVSWDMPMPNGSGGTNVQATGQTDKMRDSVHPSTNLPFWTACLAYASEIAQRAVLQNMAATEQDVTDFTGEQTVTPVSGQPRNAKLTFTTTSTDPDLTWGLTGQPMYGWYAWFYNNFGGRVHYINSAQVYTEPELPIATGLWICLKPRVHCSGSMGVNPYALQSMFSTLGEINILAGKLAGLGL